LAGHDIIGKPVERDTTRKKDLKKEKEFGKNYPEGCLPVLKPLGGCVVRASQCAGESTGAVFDLGQTSIPDTDDPGKPRRS
jgi:hypothetical protein